MFHDTFGYYAQGVVESTAQLPAGWQERLVPILFSYGSFDHTTGRLLETGVERHPGREEPTQVGVERGDMPPLLPSIPSQSLPPATRMTFTSCLFLPPFLDLDHAR